jgi:nucleotide-binding universal stress UspA family protein
MLMKKEGLILVLKKVLFAFDGSKDSEKALTWLVDFAKQTPVKIVMLGVVENLPDGSYEFVTTFHAAAEALRQQTEDNLKKAAKFFSDHSITVTTVIREGNPASEILDYASKEQVDLIICGNRGLGGFESFLIGSVTHKLLTHSPIPVLVIK